jgi:hypothetical protein
MTVVAAVGENKLMPLADCSCKVINGSNGFIRDNYSWIISRIVRDFEAWMDDGQPDGPIRRRLEEIIDLRWEKERADAEKEKPGSGATYERPPKAGLCVSVYKARKAQPGYPGYDAPYFAGFVTSFIQLGLAAIPCGIFGDWSIILVTAVGIALSFATGALPQWAIEKWYCRRDSKKTLVLTRGNGSQHAIVIIGDGVGLDLEDLATADVNASASYSTRIAVTVLCALWIFLLIAAAGIKQNTWFLLAIGALGMLQNIYVAGASRSPQAFGIPLEFVKVIGEPKVMDALFEVEKQYPKVGKSMLATFFPGALRQDEVAKWAEFDEIAKKKKGQDSSKPGVGK